MKKSILSLTIATLLSGSHYAYAIPTATLNIQNEEMEHSTHTEQVDKELEEIKARNIHSDNGFYQSSAIIRHAESYTDKESPYGISLKELTISKTGLTIIPPWDEHERRLPLKGIT